LESRNHITNLQKEKLWKDYLKAAELLTINGDKVVLQKQVTELKEKTKDNEYIIRAKLQEKDSEVQNLKEQATNARVALLKDPKKIS